jgi:hypothetical protein
MRLTATSSSGSRVKQSEMTNQKKILEKVMEYCLRLLETEEKDPSRDAL